MATPSPTPDYQRQLSTDSGMDNPFRPDGELAKEADELVEMINKGKPITATPSPKPSDITDSPEQLNGSVEEPLIAPTSVSNSLQATPGKTGSNGSALHGQDQSSVTPSSTTAAPGAVEVRRHVVPPAVAASQPEHVVIKKKNKGKCCVIQ